MPAPVSRCSEKLPVIYVWAEGAAPKSDIDAAVDALMDTLRGEGRLWNPYAEKMTRTEFRRRLEAAERGELKPVDEVRKLETGNAGWLYEIRWQGIAVRRRLDAAPESWYNAEVRAIHAEPPQLPMHIIGLHVHEKVWWPDDADRTQDAQNAEIKRAVKKFWELKASNWSLP